MFTQDLVNKFHALGPIEQARFLNQLNELKISPLSIPILPSSDRFKSALAFAQERLWFLNELEPNSSSYLLHRCLRLKGSLSIDNLQRAVNTLLTRHESLRTSFHKIDGNPIRVVSDNAFISVTVQSLKGESPVDQLACLNREASLPLDLKIPPLVRVRCFEVGDDEYLLLISIHHIISDGLSFDILVKEMTGIYNSLALEKEASYPIPAVTYSDFIAWQKTWLRNELIKKDLEFWLTQLSGIPKHTVFPLDFAEENRIKGNGARLDVEIDSSLFTAIHRYAREHRFSAFNFLLAVFNILLHRYTSSTDLVVGTPTSGRLRSEVLNTVGLFANTLALRNSVNSTDRALDVIKNISQRSLAAFDHQLIPFEQIVSQIQTERDVNHSPLFQILFIYQKIAQDLQIENLSWEPLSLEESFVPKYLITFEIIDLGSSYHILIEYDSSYYKRSTIQRISQHYINLIESVLRDHNQPVKSLQILSNAELSWLNRRNDTSVEYLSSTIHQAIFETCQCYPQAVAVECGNKQLTYTQLHQKSIAIAHFLCSLQLPKNAKVGLYMDTDIDLLPSLLGILAAGHSYLPLDSSLPDGRLKFMLEETGTKAILTNGIPKFGFDEGIHIVPFYNASLSAHEAAPLPTVHSTDLAYTMYTSGSTGKPKAILVDHSNVTNVLHSFKNILELKNTDRWLSPTTFAFDISVLEYFLPLLAGATVRLIPRTAVHDVDHVLMEIAHFKPTTIQATPSFWQMLMMRNWKPVLPMTILCGGEALPASLAKRLTACASRLYNVYGPTETTIWSTFQRIDPSNPDICVGTPIANTQVYILDASLSRVPVNVEGDLYIGGKGVTRGYLNRPELTAQRFVTIPDLAHESMFNTGDRAKFTESGAIQLLGRSDHQVKIRGFRVELSEIEHVLLEHPHVQAAAVAVKQHTDNPPSLKAFIQTSIPNLHSSIQGFVSERLPSYMIPSEWHFVKELPRLASGKIARHLLLEYRSDGQNPNVPCEFLTDCQKRLYRIWSDNLGKTRFGIHENYFQLGGHSLLAVKLVDALSVEFQRKVPLKSLFRFPSIEQFAQFLEEPLVELASPSPGYIEVTANKEELYKPFPLTHVQRAYLAGRSIFDRAKISSHLYREVEFLQLDIAKLENGLNALIQRHPALRTVILDDNSQQFLSNVPHYKIRVQDLSQRSEETANVAREQTREEMAHQILAEHRWPLFDIRVTRLPHVDSLHISINLLIADAASLEILLEELGKLYADPDTRLPPLDISFRDCVISLAKLEGSPDYEKSKEYWMDRLEMFVPGPQLPIKYQLKDVEKPQYHRYSHHLDRQLWEQLKTAGRTRGLSPNALLLTAFSNVLRTWSSIPQFSLVLTLFNRPPVHPSIHLIVGDFTEVSLLQIPVGGTLADLARAMQEQLLEDLDHRHFSGILVTQELLKKGVLQEPLSVVFTSLLGVAESNGWLEPPTDSFSITQTPQVVLDHQVIERNGELHLNWDVVESLFPAGLIPVMFESYGDLLQRLARQPESWVQSPTLRSQDIPQSVAMKSSLKKRSDTTVWNEQFRLLHEGILAQAAQQPDAIAILQAETTITYGELIQDARRLAFAIAAYQLPKESLIGILIDKSWRQVSSALAILMTGNAYVPLDAPLPWERLRELLHESDCAVVIVLSDDPSLPISQIVYDDCTQEPVPDAVLFPSIDPGQLAYVIYTSGSTGKPKGVMIEHRAVVNTLHSVNRHLGVTKDDAIYGISSLSFDLSVYDIFGVLSVGGKLVLPNPNALRDPAKWLADMQTHGVTLWNSVPYFMSMLVEYVRDQPSRIACITHLRAILLSGDSIPVQLPLQIHAIHPSVRLLSLGGATEASIWSIWYDIAAGTAFETGVPYGYSMDNQMVLVLTPDLQECAPFVEGELFIAGQGIARGYWRNPATTEKQFISHPLYGRLFRTYDKGRYNLNGSIEFLGRADRQVKVGGFRIELDEIEAKLNRHPQISQSVLVAVSPDKQHRKLHAFVILRDTRSPPNPLLEQELMGFLKDRLPAYMVPVSIQILTQIPTTRNGKIDQKALESQISRSSIGNPQVENGQLSLQVRSIWQQVLTLTHAPDDRTNFFDLGNSLKLIQLHRQLETLIKRNLPIADLFRFSTIESQVDYLAKASPFEGMMDTSKRRAQQRENARRRTRGNS